MDEDRKGQAVASFALVQLLAGFAAQLGFADPVICYLESVLAPTSLAVRGEIWRLSRRWESADAGSGVINATLHFACLSILVRLSAPPHARLTPLVSRGLS